MSLKQRNLDLFEGREPAVATALRRHVPDARVALVVDPGGTNLCIGGNRLYPHGAEADAGAHVARFLDWPTRVHAPVLEGELFKSFFATAADRALATRVRDQAGGGPAGPGDAVPVAAPFFLCCGVGLGLHLTTIVERAAVRVLYLVEPMIAALAASLEVFDWAAFYAACEARGVSVVFCLGPDLEDAARWAVHDMNRRCPPALDGALLYRHYPGPLFDPFLAAFRKAYFRDYGRWGYFADELSHLQFATINGTRPTPARFLTPIPPAADGVAYRSVPATVGAGAVAVIALSGPSLTRHVVTLRRFRDRLVLISGGSALPPLLDAGLVPDIHVEQEREPITHLSLTAERRARLADAGTRLVASLSIDPAFLEAFPDPDPVLFLRPNLGVGVAFPEAVPRFRPEGIGVDHLAMALAARLGLRRVVLVGEDLGSRDPARHHAPGTYHEAEGVDAALWAAVETKVVALKDKATLGVRVPANLGGTAYTNLHFSAQKVVAEELARALPGVEFLNAGDGVRIEAIAPLPDPERVLSTARPARLAEALAQATTAVALDDAAVRAALAPAADRLRGRSLSAHLREAARRLESETDPGRRDLVPAGALADYFADESADSLLRRLLIGELAIWLTFQARHRGRLGSAAARAVADRRFLDDLAAIFEGKEAAFLEWAGGGP